MKKNEELKHNKDNIKLTKKNYIIIILPIILILILVAFIAYYVFIISSPSNKLKNILLDESYICNKETCMKDKNNINYSINYKDFTMYVENNEYRIQINYNKSPIIELKNNEFICTFNKDNYDSFTHIDSTFSYNKQCEQYITIVNNNIDTLRNYFNKADIDVNKIEK